MPINDSPFEVTAENAAIEVARVALHYAGRLGGKTSDPIGAIFANRKKRQARRLLLAAGIHLQELSNTTMRRVLAEVSELELAGAYDQDKMADRWEALEGIARGMAKECREYAI